MEACYSHMHTAVMERAGQLTELDLAVMTALLFCDRAARGDGYRDARLAHMILRAAFNRPVAQLIH